MGEVSKTLLAYTAGIVDGEGCIGVYKMKRGKYFRHQLKLSVKMADKKVINLLKSLYGGSVSTVKITGNRKQTYVWQVTTLMAMRCLEKIIFYMITKQKHAALAIQFQKHLVSKENKLTPLSKSMADARDVIVQEFTKLNKRGRELWQKN